MPPVESLRNQVLNDIVRVLRLIEKGDTYWNTVNRVERKIVRPQENEILLIVYSPEDRAREYVGGTASSPTGITDTDMIVEVSAWFERAEASEDFAVRLVQDIETAVLADRQRSTYAKNTVPLTRSIVVSEETEPFAMLTMRFSVHYRHKFGEPGVKL